MNICGMTPEVRRQRAERHKPADIGVAIRTLANQGLKAYDIAQVLSVSLQAVADYLHRQGIES